MNTNTAELIPATGMYDWLEVPRKPWRDAKDRMRILLIDDDPVFCKVMKCYAKKMGADLHAMTSPSEWMRMDAPQCDIVIVDFDLGSCTGVDLAQRLAEENGSIPVLMISESERSRNSRWPPSVADFVRKSFGPYAILDAAFEAWGIFDLREKIWGRRL